jgi:protein translocase SecG subunit
MTTDEIDRGCRGAAILPRRVPRRFVWVKTALSVLQVLLAVLVMLGVLLQTPKASGLGGTIGGSGDIGGGYRRRRGLERSLLRVTAILIGLFVVLSAINTYVGSH